MVGLGVEPINEKSLYTVAVEGTSVYAAAQESLLRYWQNTWKGKARKRRKKKRVRIGMRDFKMKGKQYLYFYFVTKWNKINS